MTDDLKKVMDLKAKRIKSFQNSKEEGMKMFASGRDATLMVTAYVDKYKDLSDEELRNKLVEWKNWFYVVFYDTDPEKLIQDEFKEETPF